MVVFAERPTVRKLLGPHSNTAPSLVDSVLIHPPTLFEASYRTTSSPEEPPLLIRFHEAERPAMPPPSTAIFLVMMPQCSHFNLPSKG